MSSLVREHCPRLIEILSIRLCPEFRVDVYTLSPLRASPFEAVAMYSRSKKMFAGFRNAVEG